MLRVTHSVQFSCSVMSDSLWPHESQHTMPSCPSPTPEFTVTHAHRVNDAIQPSHPLSSPSPPAPIPPSIRIFSNETPLLMRWPKYWSFSFSISPSKEHPGLISFRINWLSDSLEKCKSKPQWGIISCQSEWLPSKSLQTINAGEGVEEREPSCIVGGNANLYSHNVEQCADSLKNWK